MNQAITIVDKATLNDLLSREDMRDKFANVLPKGKTVEKFIISIYFAGENVPKRIK